MKEKAPNRNRNLADLPGVFRTRMKMKRAFARGDERADYPPAYLWIEPTSRCNLHCPMCPQSEGLKREPGNISMETIRSVLDQARGKVQLVSLHFAGEPLMNKEIGSLVREVSSRNIPVIMHSNGALMTEEKGRELILAGLDQIVFSFDALPRERYEEKRPPAKFDSTLEGLRGFLRQKKELGGNWPIVTVKSLLFHGEETGGDPEAQMRKLFRGLPVDRFAVERTHSFSGTFGDKVVNEKKYATGARAEVKRCGLPWVGLAVGWDGTAYACCNDLNGEYPIGDFASRSLEDIWNGPEMRALRRNMVQKKLDDLVICASCDALYTDYPPETLVKDGMKYAAKYYLRALLYPR